MSQIKDRVEEKTEQMADREIQQIYAVDASTLYTPEAARKVYSPRKNIKSEWTYTALKACTVSKRMTPMQDTER